jgi:hypothetical protein
VIVIWNKLSPLKRSLFVKGIMRRMNKTTKTG